MGKDITLIFPHSSFLINDGVFPPLGIFYLSSFLQKNGLSVQCLDMGLGHTPDMAESDIIGISITTPQRKEAYELAQYYKSIGKTIIAGGPHATHMPGECFDAGFDFVIPREGELPLFHLLTEGKNPLIPITEMDDFPVPDRTLIKEYHYDLDGSPATVIMTSRGCPFRCSFCAKISDRYREHSAAFTMKEILDINEQYGYEAFMIFDDCFTTNRKRLKEIASLMKQSGKKFKFRCFSRANLINDETCKLLSEIGVVEVGLGIESGSDVILSKNLKGVTKEANTKAVQLLHDYGIRAKTFIIIGLPGETEQTVRETQKWIQDAKPDDVDFSIFQPLPGSLIFADPERWEVQFEYNGRALWYKGIPGLYKSNCRTKELTEERIVELRDELEGELKNKNKLR